MDVADDESEQIAAAIFRQATPHNPRPSKILDPQHLLD
jgi:hypothetical protein